MSAVALAVLAVLATAAPTPAAPTRWVEDRAGFLSPSRIIREVMEPRLRAGDRDGAVTAGADAVLAAIEGKPWAGAPATAPSEPARSPLTWILGGLGLIAFLILAITHPRMAMLVLWTIMAGGRRDRRGGGGFGGGGGRSGGGGARGGW